MWKNNNNKSGKIWAGVVTPSWDRGDMGNNNGSDWSSNQVLADFGWYDIDDIVYCSSNCLADKSALTTVTFINEAGYELGSSGSDEIIVVGHPSNQQGNGYVGIPYIDSSSVGFDGGNTCKASAWGNQHWNNDCSTHTNREIDFKLFSSLTEVTQAEVRTNILEETVSLTPNTWKHVSWVRDGTSWKSIVDGTQVGNTVTQATSLGTAKATPAQHINLNNI